MEGENISPITGLPERPKVDTITGLPSVPRSASGPGIQLQSQFNPRYRHSLSRYTDYGVSLSPFLDLEEERAQRQSTAEKWGNGLAKMFTTGAGAFVDGTAGITAGLVQAVGQQDKSKFWNNIVGQQVDSMNEWMSDTFPNYYTQAEQEAIGLSSLGYANFWADKTLNGVGYLAGMIGSTYATMGAASLAGKGIQAGSKALKLHKFTRAAATGADADKAIRGSANMAKAMDASKTAFVGLTSAFAEASVESREMLRRKEQELLEVAAKSAGVPVHQLKGEERRKAKEEATAIANTAFWLNSLVVGIGNVVAFKPLLFPKYGQARTGFGRGIRKDPKTKLWENTIDKLSPGKRLRRTAGRAMGVGAVTEAFQESTQFALQEGAAEATLKFQRETPIPFIRSGTEGALAEALDGWGDAYTKTFSTKDGLDSTMVGAIVGILGGGGGSVYRHYSKQGKKAQKEQSERAQQVVDFLNDPEFVDIMKRAEATQTSLDLSARLEKALKSGDHKTFRDIQAQLLANEALQFADAGRLDLLFEKLDEALAMDDTTFRKNFGVPEEITDFDKDAHITGLKNRIRELVKVKDAFDARYNPPERPGRNATAEEKAEYAMRLMEFDFYRSSVLAASFTIEDADGRIENLTTEISDISGETLTDEDLDGKNLDALNEKLNKILQTVEEKAPHKTDDLLEKLTDLGRLVADRRMAINAVNELNKSPESRAGALERAKNAEKIKGQNQRATSARERAQNATNEEDLEKIIEEIRQNEEEADIAMEGSPLAKVIAEIEELQKEIASKARKIETESYYKSVAELTQEMNSTEDAVERDALSKIIEQRKKDNQLDPIMTRETTQPAEPTEEDAPPAPTQEDEQGTPQPTKDDLDSTPEASKDDFEGTPTPTKNDFEDTTDAVEGEVVGEESTIEADEFEIQPVVENEEVEGVKRQVTTYRRVFTAGSKKGKSNSSARIMSVEEFDEEYGIADESDRESFFEVSEEAARVRVIRTKIVEEDSKFKSTAFVQIVLPDKTVQMEFPIKARLTKPKTKEQQQEEHMKERVPSGGVQVANGELLDTGDTGQRTVEVQNGEMQEGMDRNQIDAEGTPLPINREFVKQNANRIVGMPVKFRILETQWSSQNQTDAGNVPVGIYVVDNEGTEVLIGMLRAEKTAARMAIGNGGVTDGRVSSVRAGNLITTTENGERVFFPIKEAIGEAEAVLGTIRGDLTVRPPKELAETDPDKNEEVLEIKKTKSTPGRIAIITPRPGMGQGIKMAYTANMDTKAVEAVKTLIQNQDDNVAATVKEVVGIVHDQNEDTLIYIQKEAIPGVNAMVYFKHANGKVVRISTEEMAKALNGESYIFSIGSMEKLTETLIQEFADNVGEDPDGMGEATEEIVYDSTGRAKYRFKNAFEITDSQDEAAKKSIAKDRSIMSNQMKGKFIESFEAALLAKKRQVDINEAFVEGAYVSKVTGIEYPSYLDYLSAPEESSAPQEDKQSILTVDAKAHKGSFYYDVQVNIDTFESDPNDKATVTTPKPKDSVKNRIEPPDSSIDSLKTEAQRRMRRRQRPGEDSAEEKGRQNKKDCS